jgi:Cu/Ag efflux protein CusF
MRDRTKRGACRFILQAAVAAGILLFVGLAGCGSSKPTEQASPQQQPAGPQRYKLSGRVVSIEAPKKQVTVDAGDIPGFMAAMTMGYAVKDTQQLAPLSPEDQITADLVVDGSDVYLENIVVTKKADKGKAASESAPAPPRPPAKQQ